MDAVDNRVKREPRIPVEIDYTLFQWLKKGDYDWIKDKARVSRSMVSQTLRRQTYNEDVIYWALKKVTERMRRVLDQQTEAQQVRDRINRLRQ